MRDSSFVAETIHMIKYVICTLLHVFALCILQSIAFAQPVMRLSTNTLDFGIMRTGQKVTDTIFIYNDGNANLMIYRTNCSDGGSFIARHFADTILPNESAYVIAGLEHFGGFGKRSKTVTILSNAGTRVVGLNAEFKLGAILTFDADTIQVGNVGAHSYPETEFYFTNTGDEALIITAVKGSGRAMSKHYPVKPILPGERDYIHMKAANLFGGRDGKFSVGLTVTGNFSSEKNRGWTAENVLSDYVIRMEGTVIRE